MADPTLLDALTYGEHKSVFRAFLDSEHGKVYRRRLGACTRRLGGRFSHRVLVDIAHLRLFDARVTERFLRRPLVFLAPWTDAMCDWVALQTSNKTDVRHATQNLVVGHSVSSFHVHSETNLTPFHLGFVGNFGELQLSPRNLRASHTGMLVCVEGVVTRCSTSQPRAVRSVHWCEETQLYVEHEFRDMTALDLWMPSPTQNSQTSLQQTLPRMPQTFALDPTCDSNGHPLKTDYGLSLYTDYQSLSLQESPDKAPHGQLPRSVDVILEGDLVNSVKPGDTVRCAGVYRAWTPNVVGSTAGIVFNKILALSMNKCCDDALLAISPGELVPSVEECIAGLWTATGLSFMLHTLARALAPSVHGYDAIKCALALQLVGGVEKVLPSGSRLRGDINILIVGDPSTAKSQLLRATMRAAPLAISATGRGSSGVGLTASISRDANSGERRLEAGAVVLADRGIVCIDEFDKMSSGDRVAVHEVMEQQTVTIAKAGIHVSLNARCAILAAANPIYGQYDANLRPPENIGLPDSLLSRFDLLFIVIDHIDKKSDAMIANHVLTSHSTLTTATPQNSQGVHEQASFGIGPVGESYHESEFEICKSQGTKDTRNLKLPSCLEAVRSQSAKVERDWLQANGRYFIRKYLHHIRHNVKPELSEETREKIAYGYADLRGKADERTLPVTARCLESLIRLATASAKVRASTNVLPQDCVIAFKLVSLAVYGEMNASLSHVEDLTSCGGDHEARASAGSPTRGSIEAAQFPGIADVVLSALGHASRESEQLHESEQHHLTFECLLQQANPPQNDNGLVLSSSDLELVLKALEDGNRVMYDRLSGKVYLL